MTEFSFSSMPVKPIEKQPLITLLRRTFRRMGKKKAVRFLRDGREETTLSFEQLDKDSDSMARSFIEAGLGKGACAVLFLPKSVQWVVAHLAIQKIGAISVPLNHAFRSSELEYFLKETKPKLAVAGVEQEDMVRSINPEISIYRVDTQRPYESPAPPDKGSGSEINQETSLDDPAIILYTSGTTGNPKGAVLTHANISHDAQNVAGIWEITRDDVFLHALPLFHAHGLCFGLHTSLLSGAFTLMLDSFKPGAVLDILASKETTMFMAVPTMYRKLLEVHPKKKIDYSHLRLITSGSAPLLEKDFHRIKDTFGMEPVEREGMTETLMNFSNPLHGKRKPGSVGLPLPNLQVRIVNPETLEDVNPGQTGEIWLKGPAITPGYWRNPEETGKAFFEGWLRTGDLGSKDEDGYYYLTDRIKNIIISGGENISPREVENVIDSHDEVLECCVVGMPDPEWGEAVAAAVVPKPGSKITPEHIKALCRQNLLAWKCPKKVIMVSEIPKNRMGKVLVDQVKEIFA
jgi:malonyl-CoA/methylmalonyl-CoA synthetase